MNPCGGAGGGQRVYPARRPAARGLRGPRGGPAGLRKKSARKVGGGPVPLRQERHLRARCAFLFWLPIAGSIDSGLRPPQRKDRTQTPFPSLGNSNGRRKSIDPGVLEQTKNQIRQLVSEIAELAESDIQPAEFHVEFLNRVVAAVAASGGALWLLDGRGSLKLQHQLEFRQAGLLDNRQRAQPHDALLGVMMQAAGPQIIPPGASVEGVPNAGNPTNLSLIIAPLVLDKQNVGLVEVLMDPTRRAATQKSTLRFVSDLCDLATQYLKNRQMRQVMSQQRLWNQLEGFTHSIHTSLDLRETAYSVANEGKRLVGSDRLGRTSRSAAG